MNIIKYRLTSDVSHHELPFQLILQIHGVFILIFNTFLGAAFSLALNSFYFYFLYSNSIFTSLFTISNTTSRVLLTFMYCLSVSFAMTSLAYFSNAMNWGSAARFQGFDFSCSLTSTTSYSMPIVLSWYCSFLFVKTVLGKRL